MSYSFSVAAASKREAKAKLTVELAKVVASQNIHAADLPAVRNCGCALIDAMEEGALSLVLTGSVSVHDWGAPNSALTHASVNIQCGKG